MSRIDYTASEIPEGKEGDYATYRAKMSLTI